MPRIAVSRVPQTLDLMLATPARVISGSIDTKTADAAIHAETQALILDYLLFESTRTSLHELQERLDHGRRPDIKLGDDLLAILNRTFPLFPHTSYFFASTFHFGSFAGHASHCDVACVLYIV